MRGADAQDEVEPVRGGESCGFLTVEDQAVPHAEPVRRLPGVCERDLGDVDALGREPRVFGEGAKEPLSPSAAQVEDARVAMWDAT
ncbi:hypothetical protein GCM10023323_64940 [Streptomyces thinghirensis]|uniref:Uncharacterized protein n=1 Tax=Streptomyces thinghirensis TaxID=551547 RepID=A0ABP9TET0_9ACTN